VLYFTIADNSRYFKKNDRFLHDQSEIRRPIRRQTWNSLNPATRKPVSSKAYNRSKARNWKRHDHEPIPGFLF